MSKGLGKWQRLILATLADQEAFYVRTLLRPTYTKAQYNALLRAAIQLNAAGKIETARFMCGIMKTVVHRVGSTISREKGGEVLRCYLTNT